jgi:hypothetical protein
MTISSTTIRTNAWDTIYTYIKTTNAISTSNIFSALNSKLVRDVGYPLVILFPPNVSFTKVSVNGEITISEVSILIEIYHTSSQDCKAVADSVTSKLLAGRQTFAGNRLTNMDIDAGGSDSWEEADKKIHRISFNVSFRYVEA